MKAKRAPGAPPSRARGPGAAKPKKSAGRATTSRPGASPAASAPAQPPGPATWTAQPGPQTAFCFSRVFEVVYGGARGGGKTDAALGDFARHARLYGAAARGLLVRRTQAALEPTLERARQIFRPEGAVWVGARRSFGWPSGAILYCRYLQSDADADLYQGHSYSRVYVEEMTQFPDPTAIDKLKATLRSPQGAPVGFRATCNPGGAGHNWVKARYIDPGPHKIVAEDFTNPFTGEKLTLGRLFIPARVADNPALLARDPAYIARLQQCGSAELVRAWLEGDWDVAEGAFFDQWRAARNVVEPFRIPEDWTRFRSFDWGYATPFSVGWWAIASDDHRAGESLVIPRGALVRYREWYGKGRRANEGLRMTAEEVARGILEREAGEKIKRGVADPSIFAADGGASIGERMIRAGCRFAPADNTRVGKQGALSGWDQVRARIGGQDGAPPMLYVFSTCRDFIRTVPVLQHDPDRPEDLDTAGEDHIADETRYACLARVLPRRSRDPVAISRQAHRLWRREWGGDSYGRFNGPGWKAL
ncbi:MAG TPA: terminase family protein [Caulobacteraceae bacterium]|nr:terminase family protein [Caulobacteraceae bacterium]